MNHKAKIIPSIVLPGILTISGVAGIMAITTTTTTSALTYSSDTDVSFTFNPTLSISLSNANINIDNLLPGLSSESSPITVHVNSNTPYGYSLFASVGNSTDYNTTSLVHKSNDNSNNDSNNDSGNNNSNNNSIPSTFTSIATNASLPQLDTDNTWGYSFSNDNGTTWSNYNGLPLYSTVGNNTSTNNPALLIDTKSPADSTESIDFKIAAKASNTQASGTYNNVINFYAVGKPEPPPENLTFTAGDHIDTLMVADGSNRYKPFYVTPTSADKSIVFTAPAEGTKYIITVVPEPGYVLSSDSTNSSYVEDFSTGTLASNTLLTTTYVTGAEGDNITISAARAGSESTHPAYTSMQDLTAAQCPAYTDTAQGINVTDIRNNKSYAVAKFGNYCYMLSNIRVDGNTALTPTTSHISSDYTLPADTGSGGWTNDYCQPRMASINGEYYYNWPAATARINSTSGTSGCSNDTSNSVGDICPAGWTLPTYKDITAATLWNSGANPGMLSTTGSFYSGSQVDVGNFSNWWSNRRASDFEGSNAGFLYFHGTSASRDYYGKKYGVSVRCMRSS